MKPLRRTFDTAAKRWAGVGPYYAMFPTVFSDSVIEKYTELGDCVIDPFAGRGTAIYSAAILGRTGVGIELNPVGWVYAKAKLHPAPEEKVVDRLIQLSNVADEYTLPSDEMPEFFHACFSRKVRKFLLAAREKLNWKRNSTDWTTAALILIYLHGKRESSLSNQMRQTKSMSPQYAINWWKERNLSPPDIDPFTFMFPRIRWRYAKGRPKSTDSQIFLGDCLNILPRLRKMKDEKRLLKVKLLLTSPPYCGITNYHYDQWLRLWLLGYPPLAQSNLGKHKNKFSNKALYYQLLKNTFAKVSKILTDDAVIYVRTDSREFTYQSTLNVLTEIFPDKSILEIKRPYNKQTQTNLFGDHQPKPGEIDLVLTSQ